MYSIYRVVFNRALLEGGRMLDGMFVVLWDNCPSIYSYSSIPTPAFIFPLIKGRFLRVHQIDVVTTLTSDSYAANPNLSCLL